MGDHRTLKVPVKDKKKDKKNPLTSSQVSMDSFEEAAKNGENTEIQIPDDLGNQLNKSPILLAGHGNMETTAFNFLSMLGKEDRQFAITEDEFKKVPFSNDWPNIMRDLCRVLTGQDLLRSGKISEKDELKINMQDNTTFGNEQDLAPFKDRSKLGNLYFTALNTFRVLQGKE